MTLYLRGVFRRISPRHFVPDAAIVVVSLYVALFLRVGSEGFLEWIRPLHFALPIVLFLRMACLMAFGCYAVMWRYISVVDTVRLVKAVAASAVLIILFAFFLPDQIGRLPRAVYFIDSLLAGLGLFGIRLARRVHFESRGSRLAREGVRTLIYGAGHNGRLLAQRFKADPALNANLIGFIDDDPQKQDLDIQGVEVLGARADLPALIEKYQIGRLIVAASGMPGDALRDLVQIARRYNIRPRITARLTRLESHSTIDVYRDVELSDLLNRKPRQMDMGTVRDMIRGRRVLVTGAGGSIGSELARQILGYEPSKLILLDHSEYSLYEIDRELRPSEHDTQSVAPLLIDLKDRKSLRSAFAEHAPEIVFHAAAYKHVHLCEANPSSAILNNVQGTLTLLELAREFGVAAFVMISTDKAVNPAGVMGATKRVCELLVANAAIETGRRYVSVRFGNVLGSSGSLIPVLKKQIHEGGPVTVTHPEVRRFFMLIPEAVSLVLKAGAIAAPGDVNVLRMGEPVRIVDVAKSLIALMGKSEGEVPIAFTGLRPGEKMFEELYIRGDELHTEDPDILTLPNGDSTLASSPEERRVLMTRTNRMIDAAANGSKEALAELNQIVQSNYATIGANLGSSLGSQASPLAAGPAPRSAAANAGPSPASIGSHDDEGSRAAPAPTAARPPRGN